MSRRQRGWAVRGRPGRVFSSVVGGAAEYSACACLQRLDWPCERRGTEMVPPVSDSRSYPVRDGSAAGWLQARQGRVRYRTIHRAGLKLLRTGARAVSWGRCRRAAVFSARMIRNRRRARTCKQGRFSYFARWSSLKPSCQLQTTKIQNLPPPLCIFIGWAASKTLTKSGRNQAKQKTFLSSRPCSWYRR